MAIKLFGGRLVIGKELGHYQGMSDQFFAFAQSRYGVDYSKKNKLKAYKNVVYDCVSLIGEQLGDYRPIIQRRRGEKWETVDHEFLRLLYRPAGKDLRAASFSKFDLFEATGSYQLLQGDAFWYMGLGKTTGRPRSITLLRPDKVGTDVDPKTGEVLGYYVRQEFGDPIPLDIEEVLRFPFFNPETPYEGMSTVAAANDYIATDESTAEFTKNFFGNNAGISGVLNVKGEVSSGAFRKFSRAWREKYQGVSNAGKVAILRNSDAEFTKVGLGLDELDMTALRKMSIEDVLMSFRVPWPLLGKSDISGFGRNNIEALEYIFAKYNIDKKMQRFDNVLQFALERYYGEDPANLRVTHESIIPADKEHDLLVREKGVDKWITRDEIRQEDGHTTTPGGDKLYVPINQRSISDDQGQPAPSGKSVTIRLVKSAETTLTAKKKDYEAEKAESFRIELMRNQSAYERQYSRVFTPIIKQQRQEVIANLGVIANDIKKDNQMQFFDKATYNNLIDVQITPVLADMAEVQGGLALSFAGDTDNEFYLTNDILASLKNGTARMAEDFNSETIAKLNATLAEGMQAGEGIGALKKRVSSIFEDATGYRAKRIARTETLKASNLATLEAYRQTGYVKGKQWVVNPGACPQCELFIGRTTSLDETFLAVGDSYTFTDENGKEHTITNNYDAINAPPLHPNCRCTIIPVR